MAVLYIKEQGSTVQKMGDRLLVTKNGQTLLDQPVFKIDNIAVIGNVQVTSQALRMLMEHGVDISYLTYSGKYLGHTGADASKNIFLRFEQYGMYLDPVKRLETAKMIVDQKIQNQIAVIEDYRWTSADGTEWKEAVEQMQLHRRSISEKETVNELLGVEGICSNIYFSIFGRMIKGDFRFENRNRRPPKDPVNIILSLAYTFLTREMCSILDSESFETYLGFLHGIRYGRKSLALDMIEVFRQPAIDRLTSLLFNKRMISKYDFDEDEDGTISLNEDGFRKFCLEYERWMTGRNSIAGDNFRKQLHNEATALKKYISKGMEYHPYNWREQHVCNQLRSELQPTEE